MKIKPIIDYEPYPLNGYINRSNHAKVWIVVGLFLLSFLLLPDVVPVYGEESKQEYVAVKYPGCQMSADQCAMPERVEFTVRLEKAWIVSPYVVITMPDTAKELWISHPGEINGEIVYAYTNHLKFRIKAYISGHELKVTPNLPEPIKMAYEILLPHIENDGGILTLVDELKRRHGVEETGA